MRAHAAKDTPNDHPYCHPFVLNLATKMAIEIKPVIPDNKPKMRPHLLIVATCLSPATLYKTNCHVDDNTAKMRPIIKNARKALNLGHESKLAVCPYCDDVKADKGGDNNTHGLQ